jgi:ATP-dependent protease ClpP protease subunit
MKRFNKTKVVIIAVILVYLAALIGGLIIFNNRIVDIKKIGLTDAEHLKYSSIVGTFDPFNPTIIETVQKLKELKKGETLLIGMMSPGGYVSTLDVVAKELKNTKGKVIILVVGYAYSAAAILTPQADYVILLGNAEIGYHQMLMVGEFHFTINDIWEATKIMVHSFIYNVKAAHGIMNTKEFLYILYTNDAVILKGHEVCKRKFIPLINVNGLPLCVFKGNR